jgi:hypothetical protein
MVWTNEDSKDVMKKVLGTLLAAAMIAVVSKAYDRLTFEMTVLLAALVLAIATTFVVLRLRSGTTGAEAAPGVSSDSSFEGGSVAPDHGASEPRSDAVESLRRDDDKARKKAAKAELKRAKKEAKR